MLKTCAEQLGGIFQYMFVECLEKQRIPVVWKHSIVVPVAKCSNPKALNDFRPVALTILVMKVFVKVMKQVIQVQVQRSLDPMQLAYRVGRGVEDATLDFSLSAFSTIQPHLLAEKLLYKFKLDFNIIGWIL